MAQNPFKLEVYQEAKELAKEVYLITKDIPNFKLRDQYFGAMSAIGANLAEMAAFSDKGTLVRKLEVCIGECNEAEYWTEFCHSVDIIDDMKKRFLINKIRKLRMKLHRLLEKVDGG